MSHNDHDEPAKSVVRRNTEEVQGHGDFELFEELFPDDFVDRTPQPDTAPLRSRSWTAVTMIGSVTASSGPRPLASGCPSHPRATSASRRCRAVWCSSWPLRRQNALRARPVTGRFRRAESHQDR